MAKYKPMTVLRAVSAFLEYHDKEDYDGVFIVARQRDEKFEMFTGGSADDPDYADEWAVVQFLAESAFEEIADRGESENIHLQVINQPDEPTKFHANSGINMREVFAEQSRDLNNKIGITMDITQMKHIHPRPNEQSEMVTIHHPSIPSSLDAFTDPKQMAVVVPDGKTPEQLNAIALSPWDSAPTTLTSWVHVVGQADVSEPPLIPKPGKKLSAGIVIIEPDGRFWAVAPTNAFGGYKATFPKGTIDPGMTPQATAIREAFEESGLQVEITGWIGDFERTTSVTRYYFARRIGGDPSAMGWESQAVMLLPRDKLFTVLHHSKDHELLVGMLAKLPSF